jgi:hypothetical protein
MHYINSNACDIITLMEHAKIYSHNNIFNVWHLYVQYYLQKMLTFFVSVYSTS